MFLGQDRMAAPLPNQWENLFPNAPSFYNNRNFMNRNESGKIRIRKNKTRRNTNHTMPLKGSNSKNRNNSVVRFANTVGVRNINKIGQRKTPSGLPTSTGLRLNNSTDAFEIIMMLMKRLQPSGKTAANAVAWAELPYKTLMQIDDLPLSDAKKQEVYELLLLTFPDLSKYWVWKKE